MVSLARKTDTASKTSTGSMRPSLDDLATAVILLEASGRILAANRSAESLLGAAAGRDFDGVAARAEMSGRLAAEAGRRLLSLRAGPGSAGIEFSDGRTFVLTSSGLRPDGTLLLEGGEVTSLRRAAEERAVDPLTGVPDRRQLLNCLGRRLAETPATPLALLHLDLDRFKSVNDTMGRTVGDGVLKLAAERLRTLLGPDDVLARIGDDEFALLLVGADQPAGAAALARNAIELVGRPYLVKGAMVTIGASIGVAMARNGEAAAETLLTRAGLALARAKATERGGFCFFADEMDERVRLRRSLEFDLRRALPMRELSLAYQPQYTVADRRLVGFEALLRWHHPDKGPISPALFIPIAEELGLIGPIGAWVLRTACRDAASWPEALGIAVNLSPLQFRHGDLAGTVVAALEDSGLAPNRLELEITEGALLEDTVGVTATLHRIRALGVRISMDDFGTGYSSLSYLQKFPFDKIKIDQSFVSSMATNADSAAIVRAVSSLGASLGMTTIAEGVETDEQLAGIGEAGCQQVQGYLTGRPLPPETASALALAART